MGNSSFHLNVDPKDTIKRQHQKTALWIGNANCVWHDSAESHWKVVNIENTLIPQWMFLKHILGEQGGRQQLG